MPNLLFVYGTLRDTRAAAVPASIRGTLYDVGAYPAVVLAGDSKVVGEIFPVEEDQMRRYDGYEGVAFGLYTREIVDVHVENETKPAYVYVAGPLLVQRMDSLPQITSGDWYER